MKTMTKKQRVKAILDLLDEHYGTEKICYLNHNSPWQLLVAVILSAQCTDARVNIVTGPLFERYPSVEALAGANQKELEAIFIPPVFIRQRPEILSPAVGGLWMCLTGRCLSVWKI